MIRIGRTNEFIVRGIDAVPDSADFAGCAVDKFLRCQLRLKRLDFVLLSVLVRACLKEHVKALEALVAGDGICQNRLVSVADVRLSGCIRNRGCDVVRFLAH